jgi:hypothetical protein
MTFKRSFLDAWAQERLVMARVKRLKPPTDETPKPKENEK